MKLNTTGGVGKILSQLLFAFVCRACVLLFVATLAVYGVFLIATITVLCVGLVWLLSLVKILTAIQASTIVKSWTETGTHLSGFWISQWTELFQRANTAICIMTGGQTLAASSV